MLCKITISVLFVSKNTQIKIVSVLNELFFGPSRRLLLLNRLFANLLQQRPSLFDSFLCQLPLTPSFPRLPRSLLSALRTIGSAAIRSSSGRCPAARGPCSSSSDASAPPPASPSAVVCSQLAAEAAGRASSRASAGADAASRPAWGLASSRALAASAASAASDSDISAASDLALNLAWDLASAAVPSAGSSSEKAFAWGFAPCWLARGAFADPPRK